MLTLRPTMRRPTRRDSARLERIQAAHMANVRAALDELIADLDTNGRLGA
jgi:hypothetical protein